MVALLRCAARLVASDKGAEFDSIPWLANLSNSNFVDDVKVDPTASPAFSLNITTKDLQFIKIKGFKDSTSFLIHSSQNPEAWFDGSSLSSTIFTGKSSFLTK